jgi:hypothetical protein
MKKRDVQNYLTFTESSSELRNFVSRIEPKRARLRMSNGKNYFYIAYFRFKPYKKRAMGEPFWFSGFILSVAKT